MKKLLLLILILGIFSYGFRRTETGGAESPGSDISGEMEPEGSVPNDTAEDMIQAFAQTHGLTLSDYPAYLVELLERNPETADFVLNYPLRKVAGINMAEYDRSNGVPLLMQWDPRWGYLDYGSGIVGLNGCGPLCLSMAGYYVTGDASFAPDKVIAFADENNYFAEGYGTSWSFISEGGRKLGLDVTEIPLDRNRIYKNLDVDNPIICAMGPGDFTTSGHFIVLVGIEDGKIQVNDPNSHANSEKLWSYEEIEDQIRNLWVIR